MSQNHYLFKLIPPRPTFPVDMSAAEGEVMEAHFGYWAAAIAERKAVAYGPVMDRRAPTASPSSRWLTRPRPRASSAATRRSSRGQASTSSCTRSRARSCGLDRVGWPSS